MKKIYTPIIFFASVLLSASAIAQVAFTPGNLVVYKVGDGATTLSSASFPVTLDELTTSGTPVQSYPLPSSGTGRRIVAAGTTTSEGLITRSSDNKFLLVTGYDTLTGRAAIAGSTSALVNRVVGVIGTNGTLDATTALTDAYSGGNIRGVASTDGTNIWVAGSNGGIRYTTIGATTSTQLSTAPTNVRAVDIFNGQLYLTTASGAFLGLCSIGTGTPTTSGQTTTLLPGFPTTGASPTPSPYSFSINSAGTVVYVADDRAVASGGGVQKWTLSAGTWTLAYTLTTSTARNLVVDWSGTNPIIYAVTTATSNNKIVSTTDDGSGTSVFTAIDSSGANYVYRGIAFAPTSVPVAVTLTSFKATPTNASVQLQWTTSQGATASHFEVEKSTDDISFSSIAAVNAVDNSSSVHTYSAQDANPSVGVSYYRLKTTDQAGTISYSKIVPVNYSQKNVVKVYPNPAHDLITVTHPASSNATVTITDIHGSIVEILSINAGETVTPVNVSTLSSGQYFIKYVDAGYTSTSVLTKL